MDSDYFNILSVCSKSNENRKILPTGISSDVQVADKENLLDSDDTNQTKEGTIQYGENSVVCFACGEVIESGTKICPYCKTKQPDPKFPS